MTSASFKFSKKPRIGWLLCFIFFSQFCLQLDARTLGRSKFSDTINYYDASVKGKMEIRTDELTDEIWRGLVHIKISKVYKDVRKQLKHGQTLICPFAFALKEDGFFFNENSRYFSINYSAESKSCIIEQAKRNFR
jgi:hypothetical protein